MLEAPSEHRAAPKGPRLDTPNSRGRDVGVFGGGSTQLRQETDSFFPTS